MLGDRESAKSTWCEDARSEPLVSCELYQGSFFIVGSGQ
jgi:hypothetical protein